MATRTRATTKAAPPRADLMEREPSDLHVAFAEWVKEQTGHEVSAKDAQLLTVLRMDFQRSDANQGRLTANRTAKENAEAERAKNKEKREQDRAAKAKEKEDAAKKKAEDKAKADAKPKPPASKTAASKSPTARKTATSSTAGSKTGPRRRTASKTAAAKGGTETF